jgi:hypothetical protein
LNSLEENLFDGGRTHAIVLYSNHLFALLEHAQQVSQQAVVFYAQTDAQLSCYVRLHGIVRKKRVHYVGEHDLIERLVLVDEQAEVLAVNVFQKERRTTAPDFPVVHYGNSVAQYVGLFEFKNLFGKIKETKEKIVRIKPSIK